jgi:hypothetical protein
MPVRNTIGVDLGFSAKRLNHHLRLGEAVHERGFFIYSVSLLAGSVIGLAENYIQEQEVRG